MAIPVPILFFHINYLPHIYIQEPLGSEPESDSDFEYEGGRTKKGKAKKSSKSKAAVSQHPRSLKVAEDQHLLGDLSYW